MLNLKPFKLGPVTYDPNRSEERVELDPSLPTSELRFRLTGTINVAGATLDGVALDDAVQRVIRKLRLVRDGQPIIRDVQVRDLYQTYLHTVAQEPTQTVPADADLQTAGDTAFVFEFSVPFATRWLRRPWDLHLPAMNVRNGLTLFIEFNDDRVNATDDKGTGAIVKSGSDTYTWTVFPTLEIWQIQHPRASAAPNSGPRGIRHFESFETDTFSVATDRLREEIQSGRIFDFVQFRMSYGAKDELADLIDEISLLSGSSEWIRDYPLEFLRRMEADQFPAVNTELGYVGVLFAVDGMLSNAVRPNDHRDLRFLFKTAAPPSGDGKIVYTMSEIVRSSSE